MTGENDTVIVEISVATTSPATVSAIAEAGARILHVSHGNSIVTARVEPERLRAVAAVGGVQVVTEVLQPFVGSAGQLDGLPSARRKGFNACNPTVSSASRQLLAGLARRKHHVDGKGVTVGILSDSYNVNHAVTTAAQDVARGALPGRGNPCGYKQPVIVMQEAVDDATRNPRGDEGRAMAQLVHGVAPGAQIAFATAFWGESVMADNIRAMTDHGADVIVDDILYVTEPWFQQGIIGNAVRYAQQHGVVYLSAGGNFNIEINGANVGSWETAAYRPTACPAQVLALPNPPLTCMNFAPTGPPDNVTTITIDPPPDSSPSGLVPFGIGMQWAEPFGGVSTDLSLYMIGDGGALEFPRSDPRKAQITGAWLFGEGPDDVDWVIGNRSASGTPRTKFVVITNPPVTAVEYAASAGVDTVGPTLVGHNGQVAVAAIAFNNKTTPEFFSSRGPATYYFAPVAGDSPAPQLREPQVMNPRFTSTDRACTTFFNRRTTQGMQCPFRFAGTSAAAPNAAGVAALGLQAARQLTASKAVELMTRTARPLRGGGPTSTGAGLIDAKAFVAAAKELPKLPSRVRKCSVRRHGDRYWFTWLPPSRTGGSRVRYETRISGPGGTTYGAWRGPLARPSDKGRILGSGRHRIQAHALNRAGAGPPCTVRF